tara:strand:- start:1289 stop:1798 length:510 start_codon:yes stop_codon:yes gene_type:complete
MAIPQYNQEGAGKALDQLAPSGVRVKDISTLTLTAADSGTIFVIGNSGAATITLPACSVDLIGVTYKFVVVAADNDATLINTGDSTDSGGDDFVGAVMYHTAAALNTMIQAASDDCQIQLDDNVEHTGCGPGTWIQLTCVSATQWFVEGVVEGDSDPNGDGSAIFVDVD